MSSPAERLTTASCPLHVSQSYFVKTWTGLIEGQILGDDICDDEFMNEACFYDFGDCCKPIIDGSRCTDCKCFFLNSESHGFEVSNAVKKLDAL